MFVCDVFTHFWFLVCLFLFKNPATKGVCWILCTYSFGFLCLCIRVSSPLLKGRQSFYSGHVLSLLFVPP